MNKIYEVTFMEYENENYKTYVTTEYNDGLDIGVPCLVKECDIEYIRKYGNGIRELKYVGELQEF